MPACNLRSAIEPPEPANDHPQVQWCAGRGWETCLSAFRFPRPPSISRAHPNVYFCSGDIFVLAYLITPYGGRGGRSHRFCETLFTRGKKKVERRRPRGRASQVVIPLLSLFPYSSSLRPIRGAVKHDNGNNVECGKSRPQGPNKCDDHGNKANHCRRGGGELRRLHGTLSLVVNYG